MKYKISFITGNLKGAGTDANVSIKIFGTKKITNELVLVSKFKNFERDVSDIFFIETSDLGEIEKIKISHDNQFLGANWYLDEVIIESRSKNKSWYFPVFKWIRKDHKVFVKSTKSAVYHFEISTGTLPGSGTKDTIHISLVGEKTYTPFIGINKYLPDKELKTGNSVKFSTMLEDVGKITSVHVKSYGDSFDSNWFLNKIKIKKDNWKKFVQFPFHNWISADSIVTSSADLQEYTIKIYTGDVATGGTDANVKMILQGTKSKTKPIGLNKLIARNAFEAGNIDYIKLAHKKLGRIKKIIIWHDEKWIADGWFLNKVTIRNDYTGVISEFPYYSWLDKSADPKSTKIELKGMPVIPRPFYVIAHMVNTPSYVEEALDLGSNSIEFDITPTLKDDGNFEFDVFHGFRPDFDPDKINLMERSVASSPLKLFLENLRIFENKYRNFCLVIYDCKLDNINKRHIYKCGQQLADHVFNYFYGKDKNERIYSIFSIPKEKYIDLFDGISSRIPKELMRYIGFDFSRGLGETKTAEKAV